MTPKETTGAMGDTDSSIHERNRFFALLTVATLMPCAFFILRAPQVESLWGTAEITAIVLFFGANGHVGASFFFYLEPGIRRFMIDEGRGRFLLLPPILIGLGALTFVAGGHTVRAYVICAFWIWQIHHFTRQNHGILAFASRSEGIEPSLAERTALALTNVAGILGAFTIIAPYRATVMVGWGWQIHAVGVCVYAAAVLAWLISLSDPARRRPGWRSWIMLLLILFYLPLYVVKDAFLAVFIFLTAHGLQYLVFMGYVVRRSEVRLRNAVIGLAVTTIGVGYAVYVMQSVGLKSAHGRGLLGAAFGVIVWHFLLDARIWRLSEPFQRRTMTERFDFLLARDRSATTR